MPQILVSYTRSDRDWAFWIAKELECLGYVPHVHEWEVAAGDDIYGWMESRHDAADQVLCVMSEEYMKAPYSTLERHAALWQAAKKRVSFALLVVVKPFVLPTLSDHIRRCELFGIPEPAARARFREFMAKRTEPVAVTFPGIVFAVSNVPTRAPIHFLGRDDTLAKIAADLVLSQGRIAITALHGLRGVGKTTLAIAYAERYRSDYRATWWIRAETETSIRADLVALGVRLGWVSVGDNEAPALNAVLERLRDEGDGVLLIFDNAISAKALKAYLPLGGTSRILITSNSHFWRDVAWPVEIQLWSRATGADYLIARTGRVVERPSAELLAAALGGLPLAHEQAAAYCERLGVSFADYHARFQAAPTRLLDDWRHAPADYHDGRTVATTFHLAIEEAAKLHPGAEPLIVYAALLPAEPIPLFLFTNAAKAFGDAFAGALSGEGLDEAIAALRVFALVDRESVVDEYDSATVIETIRLHRLVREVAAERRSVKGREEAKQVLVDALIAVYPDEGDRGREALSMCRRLDALAFSLLSADAVAPNMPAATLMDRVASYCYKVLAEYPRARQLYEAALAIREKLLGPEHPDTAASLNNLSLLLMDQGQFAAARTLLERALKIREHVSGAFHPDTASVLNGLGRLFKDQGDFARARPAYERALAIREKALGPDNLQTAASLNNLALLLKDQGDAIGARSLFERALSIRGRGLGPDHPDTASSMNNLGLCVMSQGDFRAAQALFENALTSYEKAFGEDHANTAAALNNLGWLYRQLGDFARARPLLERGLRIRESAFGPEHLYITWSLNNLGLLLNDQRESTTAQSLLERALRIRERMLGPEHPDTAASLDSLAQVLRDIGDKTNARLLFERALTIRETMLGSTHPDTISTRRNATLTLGYE